MYASIVWTIFKAFELMKNAKLMYFDQCTTFGGVLLKSDGGPLGHRLLHRLVSVHA